MSNTFLKLQGTKASMIVIPIAFIPASNRLALMARLKFPKKTTLERDGLTPVRDETILNIDTGRYETYDGRNWGRV